MNVRALFALGALLMVGVAVYTVPRARVWFGAEPVAMDHEERHEQDVPVESVDAAREASHARRAPSPSPEAETPPPPSQRTPYDPKPLDGAGARGAARAAASPAAAPPEQPHAASKTLHPLDGKGLQAAVQTVLPEIKECYDGWLKQNPKLGGVLRVRMIIERDPTDRERAVVTASEVMDSELGHPAVEGCLLNALSEPLFEPPEEGTEKLEVVYPFEFASESL